MMMTPKRFFTLALVLVCAFAATSATAASVEKQAVSCYAIWSPDGALWGVRILTPDFPPWDDLVPPSPWPTAISDGTATYSGDKVSVDCRANPRILDDLSFWKAATSKRGPAYTAREQTPYSYIVRTYVGTGTATVSGSNVRITAQMHIDYSNWP